MFQIKTNAHVISLSWALFFLTNSYCQTNQSNGKEFNTYFEFDSLVSVNIANLNKNLIDNNKEDSIYVLSYNESSLTDIFKLYRISVRDKKIDSLSLFIPKVQKIIEESGSFLTMSYKDNKLCLLNSKHLVVYNLLNSRIQILNLKSNENYSKCKIINSDSIVIYWTDAQNAGRRKILPPTITIYSVNKGCILSSFSPKIPFGEFNSLGNIKLHDINEDYFVIGNPIHPNYTIYGWDFKIKYEYCTDEIVKNAIDTSKFKLLIKEAEISRDFGFVLIFIYEAYYYKYSIADNYKLLNDSEIQIRYTSSSNSKDSFSRIYEIINYKTKKSILKYRGSQSLKAHNIDSIKLINKKNCIVPHISLANYIVSNTNFIYFMEGAPINPIGYDELTLMTKQNEYLKLNDPTLNIYILKRIKNVN